ncbi:MAG TPA: hypothetical protein VHJ82_00605 [Actinomycetota bacterium]|nr:hypothetical protein [Actinomycetota bacterium]
MKAAVGALLGSIIVFFAALKGVGRPTPPPAPPAIRLAGVGAPTTPATPAVSPTPTDDDEIEHEVEDEDLQDFDDNSGPGSVNSGRRSDN